jgi:hypothetical protein
MRAAGIPARVVTGYQGGEYNPIGDYLVIRQADAHAWSEVWLDGQGWVRIDPTGAVAPQRIERGSQAIGGLTPAPLLGESTLLQNAWRKMRLGWDTLNNAWNQWVLSYGAERQSRLLSGLGFGALDWRQLSIALIISIALLLGGYLVWMLARQTQQRDAVARSYARFCRKLARRDLARAPAEGPLDYARRVSRQRPELSEQVYLITRLYTALRYGRNTRPAWQRQLQRRVQAFSP